MRRLLPVVVIAVIALVAYAFRPVCIPLTPQDLLGFNVPIEQRTDRDFYFKVFQKRDDQWLQCKTWISRKMFF